MFKKVKNCFSSDPVNSGRQREIDIAKGIALIFMTFSHSIEILGWFFDPSISPAVSWHDFDLVIKSIAPVFLFAMGLSLCYSRKKSASDLFHRGIGMVGLVLLLESFRTVIPSLIEWLIFRDFNSIRYAYQILCVDVLQFASMALLAMALFKKMNLKPWAMLAVSAVLSVIGQLLAGVSTGSTIGDYIVGYLWHSHPTSYFPLLNWLIVPVMGYAFGTLWKHLKDKSTFFSIITPIGGAISVMYYLSMILLGKWYYFSGENYCGLGIFDAAFMFIVFLTILGAGYYLAGYKQGFVWLASMGKRVNSVYCIHWTIYALLYLTLRSTVVDNYVPMWAVIPVGILVLLLANIISMFYKNTQYKKIR